MGHTLYTIGHWKFLEDTGKEVKAYDWNDETYNKFKNTIDENYTTGKDIYQKGEPRISFKKSIDSTNPNEYVIDFLFNRGR